MFPEGCEAWAEQRRTGYPRLFPVRFNHSKDGCIDTETMIRRLNFPGGLKTENAEQYAALVERVEMTMPVPDCGGIPASTGRDTLLLYRDIFYWMG